MNNNSPKNLSLRFLAGDGEMAARMRAFDWERTSLGRPGNWREPLKAMVRMMLTTQHPAYIFWGPQALGLYNDAYRALLGIETHLSKLGRPGKESWGEIWPLIEPQIDKVLAGEPATWHENQRFPIYRDGILKEIYWTSSFSPIDDESMPSGIGGVLVLCTDTTNEVLRTDKLAYEREKFASLFEQAPSFMAMLSGPDHVFEMVNPSYMRLIGERNVLGMPVAQALPEVARQGYLQLLDEVFRSGEAFTATSLKLEVQTAFAGQVCERYVDFVYQPIRSPAGEVTGIFVEGIDVTQRHAAQEALQVSKGRFKLAVEAAHLGTFDVDLHSDEVALSQKAQELFGLSSDNVTQAQCFERIPVEDRPVVAEAMAQARLAGKEGRYAVRHRVTTEIGDVRWLNAAGREMVIDGRSRLVGVVADVTEEVRLVSALQESDRRKDEFLATLAHELRNPLQAICTSAILLSKPGLTADRSSRCADTIQRQSGIMATLLDDLMEASRITSGKLELKKVTVTVQSLVDSAVEMVRSLIERKKHSFVVEFEEPAALVCCDPVRTTQILFNLLANAAKYTDPEGHITLRVTVTDANVTFTVADQGVGLEATSLEPIFEMFHQVRGSRDRTEGGLGIGLPLARGLATLHGGTVTVCSPGLGQGTTFSVVLPVLLAAPTAATLKKVSLLRPKRLRILVVDDNVDAADALAEILEIEGHEVIVAYDGVEAFELAIEAKPDVGLLDIGMPRMDGNELAEKLRQHPVGRSMLLVATTGWGQESDRQRTRQAGFDFHLTKPVDLDALIALLTARHHCVLS